MTEQTDDPAVAQIMDAANIYVEVHCQRCASGDACISQVRWDEDAIRRAITALVAERDTWKADAERLAKALSDYIEIDDHCCPASARCGSYERVIQALAAVNTHFSALTAHEAAQTPS